MSDLHVFRISYITTASFSGLFDEHVLLINAQYCFLFNRYNSLTCNMTVSNTGSY